MAAAITSVFAFELAEAGYEDARRLVPVMFFVIASTVALYGITAGPLARWLKVTQPDPRGILIVGAHEFAREVAYALKVAGVHTVLVDRNSAHVRAARLQGLDAHYGDILDEAWLDETVSKGLGKLLALTPNDKVNTLAALHFSEVLELKNVYQLHPSRGAESSVASADMPRHFMGRVLFGEGITHDTIQQRMETGYRVKVTNITPSFGLADYQQRHGNRGIPLFVVKDRTAQVITGSDKPRISSGKVIGLVPPAEDRKEPAPADDEA